LSLHSWDLVRREVARFLNAFPACSNPERFRCLPPFRARRNQEILILGIRGCGNKDSDKDYDKDVASRTRLTEALHYIFFVEMLDNVFLKCESTANPDTQGMNLRIREVVNTVAWFMQIRPARTSIPRRAA